MHFKEKFKRVGDVRLRLAFEESIVTALAKAGGGINHKFRIRAERNRAVAHQVKAVRRHPFEVVVRPNLKMNEVVTATVVFRHCFQCFPINALFVDAEAAPFRLVAEDLVRELVDAGCGFAGTGVPGDEPAAAEIASPPGQSLQSRDTPWPWPK